MTAADAYRLAEKLMPIVPDVTGLSFEEASKILRAAGFEPVEYVPPPLSWWDRLIDRFLLWLSDRFPRLYVRLAGWWIGDDDD